MPVSPSKRLVRAAEAERSTLVRTHAALTAERARLTELLEHTTSEIEAIEAHLRSLAELVGNPELAAIPGCGRPSTPSAPQVPQSPGVQSLSGPEVRRTAVRVLLREPNALGPIHYTDWFGLLTSRGYAIAGKTPKAVFLTQISRSPVVIKAARPGEYSVDRQAPKRLRSALEGLQAELRELAALPATETDISGRAGRRRELFLAINHAERDLAEATELLRPDELPHAA